MGRRAARHRFVPHYYVFPGGRVDARDFEAPVRSTLRPPVLKKLSTSCGPRLAHALAVAAARETWEETGLALGEVSGDSLQADLQHLDYALRAITPASSPLRFHARFFVAEGSSLSGELRGNGELLDLAWRPVAECLKLPVVDVTEYFLRGLLEGPPRPAPAAPLFSFRNGKVVIA